MDWNLNQNQNQRLAGRILDLLQQHREGHSVKTGLSKSHAGSLQDGLQIRGCVSGNHGQAASQAASKAFMQFKPENKSRDKWFDAK